MQPILRRAAAILAGALSLAPATLAGEDLEANLKAKLGKPFLKNAAWVQDYDEALARARDEHKLVFAYFARTYYP